MAKWRKRPTVEARKTAWEFLQHMLDDVPCRAHTVQKRSYRRAAPENLVLDLLHRRLMQH